MRLRMIGAAAMLMACSSTSSETSLETADAAPTETTPARATEVDRFWTTFLSGDVDALPPLLSDLEAARAKNANDAQLALVTGMGFVWSSAEIEQPIPALLANANRTLAHLEAFTTIAPTEPRSWAHRGTAMVTIGGATGNVAMRDEGRKMVEEKTMPSERAEAGFALAAAMSQAPAGTPGLAAAVEYFFMAYEDCLGHAIDRDAPSFDMAALEARRTSERPRDVCFNQPHWPHAEEGNFLVFGDTLEKAGKKEAAKRAWEAATKVPTFASWHFANVIEDRLAGKAHDGVGAAPSLCTQCHMK